MACHDWNSEIATIEIASKKFKRNLYVLFKIEILPLYFFLALILSEKTIFTSWKCICFAWFHNTYALLLLMDCILFPWYLFCICFVSLLICDLICLTLISLRLLCFPLIIVLCHARFAFSFHSLKWHFSSSASLHCWGLATYFPHPFCSYSWQMK